jgi:hypothetical protein
MLAVVASNVEVESEFQFERRMFGSNPEQLRSLAAWLLEQEAEEVVMESTAQYWKPVWEILWENAGYDPVSVPGVAGRAFSARRVGYALDTSLSIVKSNNQILMVGGAASDQSEWCRQVMKPEERFFSHETALN